MRAEGAPIVVKADGLAAGKGVVVAASVAEAERAIADMLGGALGQAGAELVIEECLVGEEASLFALCDGTTAVPIGTAQDHKRAFDGDRGPEHRRHGRLRAGPGADAATRGGGDARDRRADACRDAAARHALPGVLYAGLMITAEGPKLIEYNVRFGDPEAQVLMPRLTSDLVPALVAACEGRLGDVELRWSEDAALTVVMATKGYPGAYARGSEIRGIETAAAMDGVLVFHAGTRRDGGRLLADGGRVLNVTATGRTVVDAQARAYAAAERIEWPEGFYRRDIGARAWREGDDKDGRIVYTPGQEIYTRAMAVLIKGDGRESEAGPGGRTARR